MAHVTKKSPPKAAAAALVKKLNIPITMSQTPTFDQSYINAKEQFTEQMKRVEDDMSKLDKNLIRFFNQNKTVQTGLSSAKSDQSIVAWETIANCSLIEGEGKDAMLNLQFDVSQFNANEISVLVVNNILTVSAVHDEGNDPTRIHREYTRQFALPNTIKPESIVSKLARDGVLTVRAPLPLPHTHPKTASETTEDLSEDDVSPAK